jgi:cobalt-zinc-cadmium efflux system membrane fusion protein
MATEIPASRLASLWVLLPLGLLAACGGGGGGQNTASADSSKVAGITVTPAQRSRIAIEAVADTSFNPAVQTTGTVAFDADQSTQVISPISGPVLRILVQPGDHVRPGQALALVSSPDFASAVADYRKAAAASRNATRIAKLDSALFANDALARRDLDQAQTDAVAAAADQDASLQQLRSLGVDQATIDAIQSDQPVAAGQSAIRAPIEGTVVEKLITPGQLLSAGATQAFTIADLSKVWVMANVFESDLADVTRGDSARVTTPAVSQPFPGVVDYIAALVDPGTKATQVRIVVPNRGHLLKRDMYVDVGIQSRHTRHGILVPVAAVLRDEDNQPFVFVQQGDRFERRSITLGSRVGERYAIAAGLEAGDKVVANGGLFLQFAESQ